MEYTWVGAYQVCMGITSAPTQSPSLSPVDTNTFYMDWSVGAMGKCGELAVLYNAFITLVSWFAHWRLSQFHFQQFKTVIPPQAHHVEASIENLGQQNMQMSNYVVRPTLTYAPILQFHARHALTQTLAIGRPPLSPSGPSP